MYCGQGEMGEGERWEGQISDVRSQRSMVECQKGLSGIGYR